MSCKLHDISLICKFSITPGCPIFLRQAELEVRTAQLENLDLTLHTELSNFFYTLYEMAFTFYFADILTQIVYLITPNLGQNEVIINAPEFTFSLFPN